MARRVVKATSEREIKEEIKEITSLAKRYKIKCTVDHWDTTKLKLRDKKANLFVWRIKLYHPEVQRVDQQEPLFEKFKKIGKIARKLGWKTDRRLSFNEIYSRRRYIMGSLTPSYFSLVLEKELVKKINKG